MTAIDHKKSIQALLAKTKKLVSSQVQGMYRSIYKGSGYDFEEYREYQEGDDAAFIDWNVTARMGRPFRKIFREERRQVFMLLCDCSGSMLFGSNSKNKREKTIEIAAIIAFSAIKNGDRCGLILFTDKVEVVVPAKGGMAHLFRLLEALICHKAEGKKTSITAALLKLRSIEKKKSAVFIISDFLDDGYEVLLKVFANYYDLSCISIVDPFEIQPLKRALFCFRDLETDSEIFLDTNFEQVYQEFYHRKVQQLEIQKKTILKQGIFYQQVIDDKTKKSLIHHRFNDKKSIKYASNQQKILL